MARDDPLDSIDKIKKRVEGWDIPEGLKRYFLRIIELVRECYAVASEARSRGIDPEDRPEPVPVYDMAERVERLVGPRGIGEFIRRNARLPREELALRAIDYVMEELGDIYPKKDLVELSLRLALAILTEGMTIAPTDGIQKVELKQSPEGQYISIYFAGPIRAAGGTEAGLILVYADYVRRKLGLAKYRPIRRPGEDEVQRFIEELRLHEREVGRFQMRCSDEQVRMALENLPVEVTGPPTADVEVTVNRDLPRIETNRLRGGALRVINDGLIGRARKILAVVESLGIEGWEWLRELSGEGQQGSEENEHSLIEDVIMGRPVISVEGCPSSFRIRYGRGSNMGICAVGVHPAVFPLLNYFLVIGSQVKLDYPGKGAIVVPSSAAEPPVVELDDGSVARLSTPEEAESLRDRVKRILWLGDIVIPYGDVLENNRELRPSPYTPEWWEEEVRERLEELDERLKSRISSLLSGPLTLDKALEISRKLGVPLYPRFVLRWGRLGLSEFTRLMSSLRPLRVERELLEVKADRWCMEALKRLLVPFEVIKGGVLRIRGCEAEVLARLIEEFRAKRDFLRFLAGADVGADKAVEVLLGVEVPDVEGSGINVRLGRPEKASPRKMKPPVHVLFPIGDYGGSARDIMKAYRERRRIVVAMSFRQCPSCGGVTPYATCPRCGERTVQRFYCPKCRAASESGVCKKCGARAQPYREYTIDLRELFESQASCVGRLPGSLKGVKSLMSAERVPEHLAKGVLRAIHGITIFKDGTCRVDVTNAPLTRFRPRDVGVSPEILRRLGYNVRSEDEWVDIYPQDVIIPRSAAEYLVKVAGFVDELLTKVYGLERGFYNARRPEDLVGHLIVGLSPHTSAGIIGRIIGFTDAQVLYAHPLWHAAKRRDCDGDQDSIMLLLDALLNFSRGYLPAGAGGRMDAPMFINVVLIPEEVDTQVHNMDVVRRYPASFYRATLRRASSKEVKGQIPTVGDHLWSPLKYGPFPSTEDPPMLQLRINKSRYSELKSMKRKVEEQLRLMGLIFEGGERARIVEAVLNKHVFPDIVGNLRAFATQAFRCKKCGRRYRRPPLSGLCEACGGELLQTVHAKGVVKYLGIARDLVEREGVGEYLRARLELLEREISQTFGRSKGTLEGYVEEG